MNIGSCTFRLLEQIIEEKRNLEVMIANMRLEPTSKKMNDSNWPIEKNNDLRMRKGPQLGTIIQIQTKILEDENENVTHLENRIAESDDSTSIQSEISAKAAFTNEALANASFLFSSKPVRLPRKSPPVSKIDRERLSLMTDYRDHIFPSGTQKVDEAMNTSNAVLIQSRRDQACPSQDQEDADSNVLNHTTDPETNISRHEQELSKDFVAAEDPTSIPNESVVNDDDNNLDENENAISNDEVSLLSPVDDSDENEEEEKESDEEECHNGELSQISSPSLRSQVQNFQLQSSQPRDSLAEILDDSPTSIHSKRYSAITPYKTLSPHKRFKNALQRFGMNSPKDQGDASVGKSPETKMIPQKKSSFVLSRVTEWNGQLRRNMPRSLKKTRRMTSGEDVIAPRKPTLVNPYFRKNDFDTETVEYDEVIEQTTSLNNDDTSVLEEKERGESYEMSSINSAHVEIIERKLGATFDIDDDSTLLNSCSETEETVTGSDCESKTEKEETSGDHSQNLNKQNSWPDDETDELTIPESVVEQAIDDKMTTTEHDSLHSETLSEVSTQVASPSETISYSPGSSDSSKNSSISKEDIFANLIRAALSDDDSETSSHRKSSVSKNLMSAMKKRITRSNEHQVRWSSVEPTVLKSPDLKVEDTHSMNENLSLYMSQQPPLSSTFSASVNPRAINKKAPKLGFSVYSPTGDSSCSASPQQGNAGGTSEDDKENMLVYYSPSGSTLCSYSPLPPILQTKDSGTKSAMKATPKSPSALCLSPLQRTPLQARKWRTLAAKAQANKETTNSKKNRFGKKRTPLRMIQ